MVMADPLDLGHGKKDNTSIFAYTRSFEPTTIDSMNPAKPCLYSSCTNSYLLSLVTNLVVVVMEIVEVDDMVVMMDLVVVVVVVLEVVVIVVVVLWRSPSNTETI